jgi:hypothetical protein
VKASRFDYQTAIVAPSVTAASAAGLNMDKASAAEAKIAARSSCDLFLFTLDLLESNH